MIQINIDSEQERGTVKKQKWTTEPGWLDSNLGSLKCAVGKEWKDGNVLVSLCVHNEGDEMGTQKRIANVYRNVNNNKRSVDGEGEEINEKKCSVT